MNIIRLDTERVAAASELIKAANKAINGEFTDLQTAANKLDTNWKSTAGDSARGLLHQIFANNTSRSEVLENYQNFLSMKVNPDYKIAEDENKLLADQFK